MHIPQHNSTRYEKKLLLYESDYFIRNTDNFDFIGIEINDKIAVAN